MPGIAGITLTVGSGARGSATTTFESAYGVGRRAFPCTRNESGGFTVDRQSRFPDPGMPQLPPRPPFDPSKVTSITITADVANYRIVGGGEYCPAPIPCLGLTGVIVELDIRRKLPTGELAEIVNVVRAILCRDCKKFAQLDQEPH